MRDGAGPDLARQFRSLFEAGAVAGLTDTQLLERFVGGREAGGEAAFEALVARHGPMVLGVCRRALADPDDAADAFQATFLVLVEKARSVRVDDSLGRWLYGVSRKVASRARVAATRRPREDLAALATVEAPAVDPDQFERLDLLDEELGRLPEAFRTAIVLCDLGGMTHEEAARDLLIPVGTVKSRLARGRSRLRRRLERRGLDSSALAAIPAVSARLAQAAARSARSWAKTGGPAASGTTPAASAALAWEVIKTMTASKWKLAASAALSLMVAAAGTGVLAGGQGQAPDDGKARDRVVTAAPTVLDRLVKLECRDRPLNEALRILLVDTGLEVVYEGDAATRAADSKVTIHFERVKLDSALRLLVPPAWLEYRVEGDLLVLSGPSVRPTGPDRPAKDVGTVAERPAVKADAGDSPRSSTPREFAKVTLPAYVVEPPDIINVEVLKAVPGKPITGERLVRPDGTISLGYYGQVSVAGLNLAEIKEKVVVHLKEYLDDEALGLIREIPSTGARVQVAPAKSDRVYVEVVRYKSKAYYVQGDVGVPGRLPVTGNETVLDAINYSGGLIPSVTAADIRLIRPARPGAGRELNLPVDLAAILNGDATTNFQVMPGDRIVVRRGPEPAKQIPPDVEARLRALEEKLDEILQRLERPAAKP